MLQWREATSRHLENSKKYSNYNSKFILPMNCFFWLLSNELPGCPPRFSRWRASIVSPGNFLGISHENLPEFWPLVTLKPENPKLLTIWVVGNKQLPLFWVGFLFMVHTGKWTAGTYISPGCTSTYRAFKQTCNLFVAAVQAWNIGTESSRKKAPAELTYTPEV